MTTKCSACSKFMSAKGGVVCKTCTHSYHRACLLMPETARVASDWLCPECKKKLPKGDNSTTPVKVVNYTSSEPAERGSKSACDAPSTALAGRDYDLQLDQMAVRMQEVIQSELRLAREEMLREFKKDMAVMRVAVATCSERIEGLLKRIESLEARPGPTAADQSTEVQLQTTIKQLKLDLNDRDQEQLSSDLEISNFPEASGENVLHTVGLVAIKLGVSLDVRDIVFAERVGLRKQQAEAPLGASSRRIVVRLARRGLRDDLLQAARARRGLTTANMGLEATTSERRFFVNERLTRSNKQLFFRARQQGASKGWRYIWSKRGRILAKQADGKQTFSIRCDDDLERVFGQEAVGTTEN